MLKITVQAAKNKIAYKDQSAVSASFQYE